MRAMKGATRDFLRVVVAVVLGAQLALAFAISGSSAAAPLPPLSIAVIGDQNTAGMNNRVVWPTLMAERTGWAVSNYAQPEAGFAADDSGGKSFSYQVDRAQAGRPKVILLATGTADASMHVMEAVTVGAVDAINKAVRTGHQVAVVGPIWYENPVPDSIWRVNDAVENAAKSAGVPYFNAVDPPLLSVALMQSDLSGPSDQGQSVIAEKIAAWLRTEVVR